MLNKIGKITPGAPGVDAGAPPGQFVTEKFPVMTSHTATGEIPEFDSGKWVFTIDGAVVLRS